MSDSESESEKMSLRAPVFNQDWSLFKHMYLNYGGCQGFASVIDKDVLDPNLPSGQSNLSDDPLIRKKQKNAVQKNRMAIDALFIAFRKCPALLRLVLKTSNSQ